MAHEVESMFYVGETPWHRLGNRLNNPPTTKDAMIAAGLDWEVGLKALVTVDGEPVSHRATYRMSDGRVLGVVGPGYHPIQNRTAFEWFDPFVQAGEASLETAGSLRDGQRVWVLAKLNRDPSVIVPGDEVQKYILLANSHDGTLAGRVGFTPIRVVCNNTLSMAIDDAGSKLIRVRHTKKAADVLAAIRDIMNLANASFEATAEQYRTLARKQLVAGDLDKYVRLVFSRPKSVKERAHEAKMSDVAADVAASESDGGLGTLLDRPVTERADGESFTKSERTSRQFDLVKELFETGQGNQLPGVRGTYWAAYNAVTEFVTHHRGRDEQARLQAMLNDGANISRRALTTALALS